MRLVSPAFEAGGRIPDRYTCEGENLSPPLDVVDVPTEAATLALIVDDADSPRGSFVHWLIWNLPGSIDRIPEGVPKEGEVMGFGATEQGRNDFGEIGWAGPCPPPGSEHTYTFRIYALRDTLTLGSGIDRKRLEEAMQGMIVDQAELTGTFGR